MGASLGQRHGDPRTLEVREATIRGFSSGGHGDPGDFGDTGGSHEGFLQGQGNGDTETGEVHVRGFSRRNMSTLGHNRDSHQGFHWGGTWGHWGKGGAHIRGFSRRLPAEPTISPRVQNAWPRKSCRIGNIRCHQGDAHPREARGAGLILNLHAWRGQGSWSPHHTWGGGNMWAWNRKGEL